MKSVVAVVEGMGVNVGTGDEEGGDCTCRPPSPRDPYLHPDTPANLTISSLTTKLITP